MNSNQINDKSSITESYIEQRKKLGIYSVWNSVYSLQQGKQRESWKNVCLRNIEKIREEESWMSDQDGRKIIWIKMRLLETLSEFLRILLNLKIFLKQNKQSMKWVVNHGTIFNGCQPATSMI